MKSTGANKTQTAEVIRHLEEVLNGGNAHASFDDAIKNVPVDLLGNVPAGLPYSIWQLVEHIRITQWDILEFSRDEKHVSPKWPDGYWPKEKAPGHAKDWEQSLDRIAADRRAFIELLRKGGDGIYEAFSHGDGQSLFREALLIIDHTSYHTGEIIVLRRLLKDWK
jgi:DinB superfamily